MKMLICILVATAIAYFAWEPMGEWKYRIRERREAFNHAANALYNEARSYGNSPEYAEISGALYSQSRAFISLLESKPYGLPLTEFEKDLLENAKRTKKNIENYLDAEEKALDPNNPNRRLSYVEALHGRSDPKPTATPIAAATTAFPPSGFDSPEERRAYWIEQARIKKEAEANPTARRRSGSTATGAIEAAR